MAADRSLLFSPSTTREGRIILLNGTSSAGKSTLAKALRVKLDSQFHYFASDQLADAGFRPDDEEVRWTYRNAFFHGFHRSIAAFAEAGLDLLVEHIIEEQSWADELHALLQPFDVFWVGVHAPVSELERRERLRGDRTLGEALYHLKTHNFCTYQIEVDTTAPVDENVSVILLNWKSRVSVRR